MNFRIDGEPPRTTAQQKGINTRGTRPVLYTKQKVKNAKQFFLWNLYRNRPPKPFEGAVYLKTIWKYHCGRTHKDGEYKITRPDTDNALKLFKDCMTKTGFWKDDAQVVYEITVKEWSKNPGIEVTVCSLEGEEL